MKKWRALTGNGKRMAVAQLAETEEEAREKIDAKMRGNGLYQELKVWAEGGRQVEAY